MESLMGSCIEYDRDPLWNAYIFKRSNAQTYGLEHPRAGRVNGLIPIYIIHSRKDNDFVRSELLPHLETWDNATVSLCSPESLWGPNADAAYCMAFTRRYVVVVSHRYLHDLHELSKVNNWGESEWSRVKDLHESFDTYIILIENMKWDILFHSTNETLRAGCLKLSLSEWSEEGNTNKEWWKILHHYFFNANIVNVYREKTFTKWIKGVERGMRKSHNTLQKFAPCTSAKDSTVAANEIFHDHSFSPLSDENRRIHQAIHETLESLVKALGEADSHFKGRLVGVGSYFDGTRVGSAPNEFDYMFVLEELSNTISRVQRTDTAEYRLQIQSETATTGAWLSNILLRERLYTLIPRVMIRISLPEDLHHGGILSPCFSGIRKNGPAITLLFAWTGGTYTDSPLLISVDMTVSVRTAHLERFADELTHFLKSLRVGNDLEHHAYLIAHPNRHNVWVMTSAAMEVSIMSNLSNRYVRIIGLLKILNKIFLTIHEWSERPFRGVLWPILSDSSDISKIKTVLDHQMDHISKFGSAAIFHMEELVSFAMGAQRYWFKSYRNRASGLPSEGSHAQDVDLKLLENGNIPSDFQDVAKLIHTLCCAYVRNSTSYIEQTVESNSVGFDYLADLLPPEACEDVMEDYKPVITLKSCVFKYVIIGALLSGEMPKCFTDDIDTDGNDLEAIVWVLEQIRKSTTLSHPLLGVPIQTYSLSYRGYVVAPRFMSSHIENRLCDVLYSFLDTLITTLKESTKQDCTGMEQPTHLNEGADLCEKASKVEKLDTNDDLLDAGNFCKNEEMRHHSEENQHTDLNKSPGLCDMPPLLGNLNATCDFGEYVYPFADENIS